jgi:Ni/Co efflux regulator RcnB
MKRPLITALIAAITIAATPLAQADGRDHDRSRHDTNRHGYSHHDQRHDARNHKHSHGKYTQRWSKGERVSTQYRSHRYVVRDWRGHHLHRPASGQQWIQVDNNYLLISIASGLIVQALLNQ